MSGLSTSENEFGVIVCDKQGRRGGPDFLTRRVRDMIGENGEKWKTFIAEQGEFPSEEEMKSLKGIYIGGSKFSVNDENQPWIQKLEVFIRKAYELKRPNIFGVCFGHQAIGKALGGKVARNPSNRFVCNNEEIVVTGAGNDSSFLNDIRKINEVKPLRMLQCHIECVEKLPQNARSVASSDSCHHEIVLYSENIIGIQSHPDFYIEDLSDIIIPSLLGKNAITQEEYEAAMESLEIPNTCSDVAKAARNFLKS